MRYRRALLAAVLGIAAVAGLSSGAGGSAATSSTSARGTLTPFASCGAFLRHVKGRALPLVGPYGFAGGTGPVVPATGAERADASPVAGVDYSTTNVQEDGVDEPDLVKSNGTHLFVVRSDRLFVVAVAAGTPRRVGSVELEQGWSHELLLHGDRLLVLSRGGGPVRGGTEPAVREGILPAPQQTVITEIDVSRPASPEVKRSLVLSADYVSARLVGAAVRIVTVAGMPGPLPLSTPTSSSSAAQEAAVKRNRQIVAASGAGSWLPRLAVRGKRGQVLLRRSLVTCRDVRRPQTYSGLGLLTVTTFDLRKGLTPVDSDAVLADGQTVYASPTSLYVATQRWFPAPQEAGADPPRMTTTIHRFQTSDPLQTHYRASGTVGGYVLNQWALSEHAGVLRVASTEEPVWWNPGPQVESESFVTTLTERAGALVQLGRIGGLGKGERVYAVRFEGDRGYVVTFRQVDPLYTLDLSLPAVPRVLGELKIAGYSAYLHPLAGDLLLGVGQDATVEGRVLGTQLSLFDVSNLRRPTRLDRSTLGPASSEAEWDHHAFLWWPRENLAVVPVSAYAVDGGGGSPFVGAVAFRVTRGGIEEVGRVAHAGPGAANATRVGGIPIRRSLVVRSTLYTVSESGVRGTRLTDFGDAGWAAFPTAG
ncbi:MAG: beta-propeller domain-containing protein [Gaiella sp.]